MKIEKYKCCSCSKSNNYTDEMRCSSCGQLHNSIGEEQKFKIVVTILTSGTIVDDITELSEKEMRMVLGLSSVNDETWIKQVDSMSYTIGTIKYEWTRV
jgi:hypothetical protein